jgi:hypothetical protein
MKTIALGVVLLVVPGWCQAEALDKTGTTTSESGIRIQKCGENMEPANAGSMVAERAGFEPAVRFYPYAALAKRCFRPLSHLSERTPRQ